MLVIGPGGGEGVDGALDRVGVLIFWGEDLLRPAPPRLMGVVALELLAFCRVGRPRLVGAVALELVSSYLLM